MQPNPARCRIERGVEEKEEKKEEREKREEGKKEVREKRICIQAMSGPRTLINMVIPSSEEA